MRGSLSDKYSFHLTTRPAPCKEGSEGTLYIGLLLLIIHNPDGSQPWGGEQEHSQAKCILKFLEK